MSPAAQSPALQARLTLESTQLALRRQIPGARVATRQVLKRIESALCASDRIASLRCIDHAWRTLAEDASSLAPIYARLLALEGRDHEVALRLIDQAGAADPDLAALAVSLLLGLRREWDARQRLEQALAGFCVLPDGLLAHVAAHALAQSDDTVCGWIGLDSQLHFIGEMRGPTPPTLDVRVGSGPEFSQLITAAQIDGRNLFRFKLGAAFAGTTVHVSCPRIPLLGSGLTLAADFGLDGRAAEARGALEGWARIGWRPHQPVQLRLTDERGHREFTDSRDFVRPGSALAIRDPGTAGDERTTDPDLRAIAGSALGTAARHAAAARARGTLARGRLYPSGQLASVGAQHRRDRASSAHSRRYHIPVYQGLRESLDCIESVLATAGDAAVIVIDDASPDVELAAALDALAAEGRIILLRNRVNRGFVESVNRALARRRAHDVVLLNSDTRVFGDWLERLRAAAYRQPKTGTVTPFTNSGAIASYPGGEDRPLTVDAAADLHALAGAIHGGVSRAVPVGVGFCLYLRRDCLREIGDFDAAVFGKGYGEETDFCLRASRRGWSHVLAADVFVYHAGGGSFGARRAALLDRAHRLINIRYPGYDRFIADFLKQDPLNPLRRALDERRLLGLDAPVVLLVSLALAGGVQRVVNEHCRELRRQGFVPLVLRPAGAADDRRCELSTDAIDAPNLRYSMAQDLEALGALLGALRIEHIELHHFLHLDARVIECVRGLDAPYDVFVHDYAWICPRVTLIAGRGRYCGEPSVKACESCIQRNGSQLGESISVAELRRRSAVWLGGARQVYAPSADTARRLERYFDLNIEVRPLAPAAPDWTPPAAAATATVVRVAVIGAIGEHKGYRVLLECARDARARDLPLEFVVVGFTEQDSGLLATGKVAITGRYGEGEALHLLRREAPHLAFFPSVTPETWCFALDEALAAGLPIVAFDLGAIAERTRHSQRALLLPLLEKPSQINDRLLQFAAQRTLDHRHNDAMIEGTMEPSPMTTTSDEPAAPPAADALSASVQVLPLPAGLYLFSVKAAEPAPFIDGQLRLPAIHVGLGPGARSDQIEFVTGPANSGAWLISQEDLLVVKVSGSGTPIMLTSVRGPGGMALSIKVERLDQRNMSNEREQALAPTEGVPVIAPAEVRPKSSDSLPLQISAHIRSRGDMSFRDSAWAGRIAPGLWLESFSIAPLETFGAQDIEYKGLTASGFETPWLSDNNMCGTKGMAVPLVGFAVRLKPGAQSAEFDCEYSGYFKSGVTVGPARNGAPCRSTVANDPLEGIQIRLRKRAANEEVTAAKAKSASRAASTDAVSPLRRTPARRS